ncbi:MAG: hypothetical protein ACON39_02000 [Coraliomargaritaceae bacterium]
MLLYLLVFALPCPAQYQPIALPKTLTFDSATPAYDPADATNKLGDFQPGVSVSVIEEKREESMWLVAYKRYGQPEVQGLIQTPNLSLAEKESFERVRSRIEAFPLLQALLQAREPWPKTAKEQAKQIFGEEDNFSVTSKQGKQANIIEAKRLQALWGIQPLAAMVRYTDLEDPVIVIEIWNKGDADKSTIRPAQARGQIQEYLGEIQSAFPTPLKDPAERLAITAIKIQEEVYLLPNDLRVALRYKPGEYLLLSFQSVRHLRAKKSSSYDPDTFSRKIAGQVKTSATGHRYISSIPMIDQGEKGYCAAATLARVLQFYGYPIDMHAMADLAETEGRYGTHRDEIIRAMRRICNSTPFKLRELKDPEPELLLEQIEAGIPLIWFIPGHARLIIGMHPEKNEIVYSDTWGSEYNYRIGDWVYFANNNREIWTLLPEGHR